MACRSCAKKAASMNQKNILKPINCTFSQEELEIKLQAAINSNNRQQITYLRRSLNNYGRNCNKYLRYIK